LKKAPSIYSYTSRIRPFLQTEKSGKTSSTSLVGGSGKKRRSLLEGRRNRRKKPHPAAIWRGEPHRIGTRTILGLKGGAVKRRKCRGAGTEY